MNHLNKLNLLGVTVLCLSLTSLVFAGGAVPGGGDTAEIEFKAIAQTLAKRLNKELGSQFPEVSPSAFENKAKESKVIMTSATLEKDGLERDALNYQSESKIEVNRPRWIVKPPRSKILLVFHEYLGLLGKDVDYSLSTRFAETLTETLVRQIAMETAPVAIYRCKLSYLNPEDARTKTQCGSEFLLINRFQTGPNNPHPNPFEPVNSHYSHVCDGIHAKVSDGAIYRGNFEASLIKLAPGAAEDWEHRQPMQYTHFIASIYSPPGSFELSMTIDHKRHLLGTERRSYNLYCVQATDKQ